MGLLDRAGARLTNHPEEAEILIVNTCSFIDTAKQESIDTILEMAQHKTTGRAKKLIVAGCLVERYRDEIQKSIPEVDAVVGTGELESILQAAGIDAAGLAPLAAAPSPFNILSGAAAETRPGQESQSGTHKAASPASRQEGDAREQQGRFRRDDWEGAAALLPSYLYDENTPRLLTTPKSSAYIKDRRGLRPPLHLLRDSQPARQVPFAPLRVGGRRGPPARRPRRAGDHPHRPGHHLLRRRPRPQRRPRHPARRPGPNRRPALAALPLRLSQPHHFKTSCHHRPPRQHLQISRCAPATRLAGSVEAHEARRRRRHLPQDSGKSPRRRSRHRPAHQLHRWLPRRVAPRF